MALTQGTKRKVCYYYDGAERWGAGWGDCGGDGKGLGVMVCVRWGLGWGGIGAIGVRVRWGLQAVLGRDGGRGGAGGCGERGGEGKSLEGFGGFGAAAGRWVPGGIGARDMGAGEPSGGALGAGKGAGRL